MKPKEAKALIKEVAAILWEEWDPIGVNDGTAYGGDTGDVISDEYDSYAPSITGLLIHGADVQKVSRRLSGFVEESMGLQPSRNHNARVARLLLEHLKTRKA